MSANNHRIRALSYSVPQRSSRQQYMYSYHRDTRECRAIIRALIAQGASAENGSPLDIDHHGGRTMVLAHGAVYESTELILFRPESVISSQHRLLPSVGTRQAASPPRERLNLSSSHRYITRTAHCSLHCLRSRASMSGRCSMSRTPSCWTDCVPDCRMAGM